MLLFMSATSSGGASALPHLPESAPRGVFRPTPVAQPNAAGTISRHVLLVEDNPDSRDTLQMLVEMWGHRVEVAANGEQGIRQALAHPPDVAVIDIGLPIINGYDVARRLRATFGDRIRLIALTAYARPDDRRRAMEAGFHFFMSKPADLEVLARLLSR